MINLRYQSANYEIYLAIAGAFGMMVLMLHPFVGKLIMGGALSLLFLLYLVFSLISKDPEADSHFQIVINRINFAGAALASIMLLLLLFALPGRLYLAMPALMILAVCLVLNIAHQYIYRITSNGFLFQQIRLLLLAGLIVMVLLWGP